MFSVCRTAVDASSGISLRLVAILRKTLRLGLNMKARSVRRPLTLMSPTMKVGDDNYVRSGSSISIASGVTPTQEHDVLSDRSGIGRT